MVNLKSIFLWLSGYLWALHLERAKRTNVTRVTNLRQKLKIWQLLNEKPYKEMEPYKLRSIHTHKILNLIIPMEV